MSEIVSRVIISPSVRKWFIAVVLAVAPTAAFASSISMVYDGPGRSRLVDVSVAGAGPDWYNASVRAGEYKWHWNPDVPAEFAEYDDDFYTYCVDLLNTNLETDTVAIRSTNLLTVSGVPDAGGKAAWLFNTYASVVHAMPYGDLAEKKAANDSAAALQVAIWEAMLDSSNDLLSGTFKLNTTGSVKTKAITYLSALYSGGPSGYNVSTASWLDADNVQDQIYLPGQELPGVPEPSTVALLSTGLIGALVARWRRRRSRPTP